MKSLILIAVCLALANGGPLEVFRYEDEDTKQSHYMMGEPGKAVEGGWTFETPGGEAFELTYKADEMGFQPVANHIPVPVEDTNEVSEAKTKFYQLFEEQKEKVEAAQQEAEADTGDAVVSVAKRSAFHHQYYYSRPHTYFYRHHGFQYSHPKPSSDDPDTEYVYKPYHGFVPADEEKEEEEAMTEEENQKYYKYVPNHGYVPEDKAEELMNAFYKYNPYKGFVPVNKDGEEIMIEDEQPEAEEEEEGDVYVYKMFKGYVKLEEGEEPEAHQLTYRLDPYLGYVQRPVKKSEMEEEEDDGDRYVYKAFKGFTKLEEGEKAKYHEQEYKLDRHFGYVPVQKKLEDLENTDFVYKPFYGFVPVDEVEKSEEEKDEDAPEPTIYRYDPMYGYVKKEKEGEEKEPVLYKYKPHVGYVRVDADKEEEEPEEVGIRTGMEDEQEELKYIKHPYYGFVSTKRMEELEKAAKRRYKYDPFYGYVPVDAIKDDEEEEESRRKRSPAETKDQVEHRTTAEQKQPMLYAHQVLPQFHFSPGYQFLYNPVYVTPGQTPVAVADSEDTQQEQQQGEQAVQGVQGVQAQPGQVLVQHPVIPFHPYPGTPLIVHPVAPVGVSAVSSGNSPLPVDQFPAFEIPQNPEEETPAAQEF